MNQEIKEEYYDRIIYIFPSKHEPRLFSLEIEYGGKTSKVFDCFTCLDEALDTAYMLIEEYVKPWNHA